MSEVVIHKETGALAIVTPVYIRTTLMESNADNIVCVELGINIEAYQDVGFAFENQHGVVVLLPRNVIEKNFEVIGEF